MNKEDRWIVRAKNNPDYDLHCAPSPRGSKWQTYVTVRRRVGLGEEILLPAGSLFDDEREAATAGQEAGERWLSHNRPFTAAP